MRCDCSDRDTPGRSRVWNQPGEMQKGSQGRRHLSLSEQAGRGGAQVPTRGLEKQDTPVGRPTTERVVQVLRRNVDFLLKATGRASEGLSAAGSMANLVWWKAPKGGLRRSLETCGPEEGRWELARERGEAAAIGQRKQESLPLLRTQRCKHNRQERVQDNTHVCGLGNEAEVRSFDYRNAVFCHLGNISNAHEGGNVFFIRLH